MCGIYFFPVPQFFESEKLALVILLFLDCKWETHCPYTLENASFKLSFSKDHSKAELAEWTWRKSIKGTTGQPRHVEVSRRTSTVWERT